MSQRPDYFRVFLVFARNSLVRDMTFRSNFLIEAVTSMAWMLMNLAFYVLIYSYTLESSPAGASISSSSSWPRVCSSTAWCRPFS